MKYRKKPVVIEAWQWLPMFADRTMPPWVTDALNTWPREYGIKFLPEHPDGPRIEIAVRASVMVAHPGDWIVRGAEGALYPVAPDIFEETYEPVEE